MNDGYKLTAFIGIEPSAQTVNQVLCFALIGEQFGGQIRVNMTWIRDERASRVAELLLLLNSSAFRRNLDTSCDKRIILLGSNDAKQLVTEL